LSVWEGVCARRGEGKTQKQKIGPFKNWFDIRVV